MDTDNQNPAGSDTPALDAPANSSRANPPAPGDAPRIVSQTSEEQREVDEKGNISVRRSVASAYQGTEEGITGAPDGVGAELEGGQGQTAPADITEEGEGEGDDGSGDSDKAKSKTGRKPRS